MNWDRSRSSYSDNDEQESKMSMLEPNRLMRKMDMLLEESFCNIERTSKVEYHLVLEDDRWPGSNRELDYERSTAPVRLYIVWDNYHHYHCRNRMLNISRIPFFTVLHCCNRRSYSLNRSHSFVNWSQEVRESYSFWRRTGSDSVTADRFLSRCKAVDIPITSKQTTDQKNVFSECDSRLEKIRKFIVQSLSSTAWVTTITAVVARDITEALARSNELFIVTDQWWWTNGIGAGFMIGSILGSQ